MQIQYSDLLDTFEEIFIDRGFEQEDAHAAATIFANNSVDGIYSHGVNRFPKMVSYIDKGHINPDNKAICEQAFGAFERWNGKEGLGPLNAKKCMDRAISLAKENGIGIVALRNTNHWMRGGTYGWMAADAGCIGMCWSNTMPNMPAWGGKDRRIGNNPFIMAIPRSDGKHVVADLAMSQYSYGKIEDTRLRGLELPVYGGYDTNGNLTTNPGEIEKTWRVLPIGFWKGSGLSIAFDLIASVLSAGNSVKDIGELEDEIQLSQIFIAVDPSKMNSSELTDKIVSETVEYIKSSEPSSEDGTIYYPGEIEFNTRQKSLSEGIPVIDSVWEKIQALKNTQSN
jgi:3-dehydro-L-gulonate 2-dehydrogenase